jgi:hypothetical protein
VSGTAAPRVGIARGVEVPPAPRTAAASALALAIASYPPSQVADGVGHRPARPLGRQRCGWRGVSPALSARRCSSWAARRAWMRAVQWAPSTHTSKHGGTCVRPRRTAVGPAPHEKGIVHAGRVVGKQTASVAGDHDDLAPVRSAFWDGIDDPSSHRKSSNVTVDWDHEIRW